MYLHLAPRRAGKTTRIIEWLKQDSRHRVIVPDKKTLLYYVDREPDISEQVFTAEDLEIIKLPKGGKVAVDDAESVLQAFIRHKITHISMNSKYRAISLSVPIADHTSETEEANPDDILFNPKI